MLKLVANMHDMKIFDMEQYTTLVRPILEFCCTVWSPHTILDIQSLEKKVQRNAARYVCGDYSRFHSVTAILDKLQWPTLKDRRHHLIAAMMYKIVNNLIDIEASLYTPTTSATHGHSRRYLCIQARINAYLHSFFPLAVRIWNRLPAQLVNATSLE